MQEESIFNVHMPEVFMRPNLDEVFNRARELAKIETILSDGKHLRRVVIITPGRLIAIKDSYLPGKISNEQIIAIENLIPSNSKKNIAVIAYTFLEALRTDIRKAIPFFDYLLGFAYIGHSVWIFEGHPSVFEIGCRKADFVLVDSRMVPFLQSGWEKTLNDRKEPPKVKILSIPED